MKNDSDLQRDVFDELKWEPAVHSTNIGVIVKDGVVTLEGVVDSYPEKWAAERAAKRVSGAHRALRFTHQPKLQRVSLAQPLLWITRDSPIIPQSPQDIHSK